MAVDALPKHIVTSPSDDIPSDVRRLIVDRIESVMQVEVLIALQLNAAREFSAADVARELRIDPAGAQPQLDNLCARGLLAASATSPKVYRYAPQTPEVNQAVVGLVQAYADRRVSVINMIYNKPADSIRNFADAFRLRKDPGNG